MRRCGPGLAAAHGAVLGPARPAGPVRGGVPCGRRRPLLSVRRSSGVPLPQASTPRPSSRALWTSLRSYPLVPGPPMPLRVSSTGLRGGGGRSARRTCAAGLHHRDGGTPYREAGPSRGRLGGPGHGQPCPIGGRPRGRGGCPTGVRGPALFPVGWLCACVPASGARVPCVGARTAAGVALWEGRCVAPFLPRWPFGCPTVAWVAPGARGTSAHGSKSEQ